MIVGHALEVIRVCKTLATEPKLVPKYDAVCLGVTPYLHECIELY
jgi:hypothetical protein